MTGHHLLAAASIAGVAVLHSLLGESLLVRPLLADRAWRVRVPRPFADRIVRFAWHLTSIAWIALAGTALGLDGTVALTIAAVLSAALVVVLAPGHLAWPLFLAAALWGGLATGSATPPLLRGAAGIAVLIAAVAAAVHLAWAFGIGTSAARLALPTTRDGDPPSSPSRAATVGVAVALSTFGAALALLAARPESVVARVVVATATVVLVARAVGDGRYVGFTKRVRTTAFARRDDLVFTPIVVVLALGAGAALAI